ETLFCLDYFLDFPERIKVYNEFISNSGIKINNQDMAEEYVKTLVSLSNLYVIKSFSKGDVSNKLFTNRSCYHIRALIIRNVAIDPINFELDEKAFDLNIKVDNKGKMAIEENK
ncbi:MAG TPA: hypothetical protein VFD91_11195, partial [Mariniphaga sp.]|nr:hypothetical protein [Mariniphaga sp.]